MAGVGGALTAGRPGKVLLAQRHEGSGLVKQEMGKPRLGEAQALSCGSPASKQQDWGLTGAEHALEPHAGGGGGNPAVGPASQGGWF